LTVNGWSPELALQQEAEDERRIRVTVDDFAVPGEACHMARY